MALQPQCSHCHSFKSPLWRRGEKGEILCNACGLYWRNHGAKRPLSMKKSSLHSQQQSLLPTQSLQQQDLPQSQSHSQLQSSSQPQTHHQRHLHHHHQSFSKKSNLSSIASSFTSSRHENEKKRAKMKLFTSVLSWPSPLIKKIERKISSSSCSKRRSSSSLSMSSLFSSSDASSCYPSPDEISSSSLKLPNHFIDHRFMCNDIDPSLLDYLCKVPFPKDLLSIRDSFDSLTFLDIHRDSHSSLNGPSFFFFYKESSLSSLSSSSSSSFSSSSLSSQCPFLFNYVSSSSLSLQATTGSLLQCHTSPIYYMGKAYSRNDMVIVNTKYPKLHLYGKIHEFFMNEYGQKYFTMTWLIPKADSFNKLSTFNGDIGMDDFDIGSFHQGIESMDCIITLISLARSFISCPPSFLPSPSPSLSSSSSCISSLSPSCSSFSSPRTSPISLVPSPSLSPSSLSSA